MSTSPDSVVTETPHPDPPARETTLSPTCSVQGCRAQVVPHNLRLDYDFCPEHTREWLGQQSGWQS